MSTKCDFERIFRVNQDSRVHPDLLDHLAQRVRQGWTADQDLREMLGLQENQVLLDLLDPLELQDSLESEAHR